MTPHPAATPTERNKPPQIPDGLACFQITPSIYAWATPERAAQGIGLADPDVWYERMMSVAERRVDRAMSPDQLAGDLPTVDAYRAAGLDLLCCTEAAEQRARWLSDVFALNGKSVLVHGCACGLDVLTFGRCGASVCGCDDRAAFIARGVSERPGLAEYLDCATPTALPYKADTFDFVHADFWPFRWTMLMESFREARRVMKPGAMLYLRVDTREQRMRRIGRGVVESFYRAGADWIVNAERAGLKNRTPEQLPRLNKHPHAGTAWFDWWVAVFQKE